MTAVMTPTGHAAEQPRDEVGGREQARPEQRRERQHEPRVRADEQPHDVWHDEPDEADQPRHGDPGRRHERGEREQDHALPPDVDAEVRRRLLAEQEPVERRGRGAGSRGCRR